MFKIGCHLSTSEGYYSMGQRIINLGGNTFQYFTKNPKGRAQTKTPSPEDVSALRELILSRGMTMPLAHAPYTYNPCSKDEEVRRYSGESMHGELVFLENLPGSMYNFHPGCHVGQGVEQGVCYISDMLNRALWGGMHTTVLLETMAGKGTEIGRSFEELRMIIDRVDSGLRDNLGVCFDTCHVNDAGYDIVNDLDGVLLEFDRIVGIDRLRAVHLNDSMNPMGSHKDRHAKIGEGTIGLSAIKRIINHPALCDRPFYLETPNDEPGYGGEIALLTEAYYG
ncbi:MAG: deoxyribonuclease IV [Ruminococcaceae bacterium]|nr:deoxyribonuclease IV [Oscillospiraceae bacterium]